MNSHIDIQFFSLFSDLASYQRKYFRRDLFAAFTVALLTIPQSIAYAMLAGLPPVAGLYCAVFGTLFCASFCSSRHLVSGPTTAIAILIQTSLADVVNSVYGPTFTDADVLFVLTHLVFVIGLIQMVAGFFNIEKVLRFISRSVIMGYFAGVAVAILIGQLFPLMGITPLGEDHSVIKNTYYLITHLNELSLSSLILGLICLWSIFFFKKKWPKLPGALLMIVFASFLAITPFFNAITHLSLEGIGDLVPNFVFPITNMHLLVEICPPASAIALLGIFEVFSVSRNFGTKSGQNIRINQEVFSIGITNILLSCIFPAMAASGSTSRTSLNFQNGAKTRFSAIISAFFVVGVVWIAFPLISYIPQTALAALLIGTVVMIIDFEQTKISIKATRGDFLAFGLTFISCFFFRLDIAFYIGIIISIAFYLKKAAEPHLVEYAFNEKGRLVTVSSKEKRRVRIVGYAGELFFGVADFFQKTLQTIAEDKSVQVIVVRLNRVFHVDASICYAILSLAEYMQATNRHVVITGVTEDVLAVFKKASIYEKIGAENFFLTDEFKPQFSTWKGCLRAKELLQASTVKKED